MRYGLFSTCTAALLGAALSAGAAEAQSRPGWVDPPAKAEVKSEQKPASPPPAQQTVQDARSETVKPETVNPEAAESGGGTVREKRSASGQGFRRSQRQVEAAQRHSHRRLSQVPATMDPANAAPAALPLTVRSPGMANAAATERFPEWARTAQRLTEDYLDAVSAPGDAMVASAPRYYAERVRFHGRTLSLSALLTEKRRFVRRWPERRYAVQDGSLRTACSADTASCIVRSTFDFRADNPRAGARSQGTAELTLEVSFAGPRPVIVAESSRVLRRYAPGQMSAAASTKAGA